MPTSSSNASPPAYVRLAGDHELALCTRLMHHAFATSVPSVEEWLKSSTAVNLRMMRVASQAPVAALVHIPMGQYFGGRSVSMLGIAGVAVAPEARGQGHAKRMMQACVREAADSAFALLGLYASTQSLYRAVGFEHGGSFYSYHIPFAQIPVGRSSMVVRPIDDTPEDQARVKACYAAFASRYDGMLDRGPYIWSRVRKFREQPYHGFAVLDENNPDVFVGYVFLNQQRLATGRADVSLTDFVFLNEAAGRRLWSLLADYGMMSEQLTFAGGPTHPAVWLLPQTRFKADLKEYWLVRVSDLVKAFTTRGYAPGINAEVHLDLADELLPSQHGKWVIRVTDGRAQAERGGRGDLKLGPRGLAALFTGFLTPAQAKGVGLLDATDQACAATSAIFAPSQPWMTDAF